MILLDTNVVSELMRPRPDAAVFAWVAHQPRQSLLTTSVTKAEILYGIALLADGRRKVGLGAAAQRMFGEHFANRILGFDAAAAVYYAEILTKRRRAGKPMATLDAQIAAIALTARTAVATRDVTDFEGCGLAVVNPWAAA